MTRLPFLLLAVIWLGEGLAAQTTTNTAALVGGGHVSIREEAGTLHVVVKGPRAGLASLCVGDETRIRILHASAAVGEATYAKSGDRWVLKSRFDFKLRDARTGPPSADDKQQYYQTMGWVANSSHAGAADRAFQIRMSEDIRFIGVTFFATGDPMAVSYWPAGMEDDCRAVKVAQGFLPDGAQFHPTTWLRLMK